MRDFTEPLAVPPFDKHCIRQYYSIFHGVYLSVFLVFPATLPAEGSEWGLLEREDSSQQGGALQGSVTCHKVCVSACSQALKTDIQLMHVLFAHIKCVWMVG